MHDNAVRVLLIEDNPDDAFLIKRALAETQEPLFKLESVSRLSEGLKRISQNGIDAVLLDLSLPDSHGFDTFSSLHSKAPQMPIVLLTGMEDEDLAVQAARQGAQDYLVKNEVNGHLLARSIRYAVERQRLLMKSELQALENARLYRELEASKEEMAVVDSVAGIITSTLEIDQVYEQFALEVKKLVDFDRIYISVKDQSSGQSIPRYLFGLTQPEHFTQPVEGIASVAPAELDPETGSSLDLDLISNGRVIGSMGVRSCRVGIYSAREQTILERLARQIAPALENSELYKQIQASMDEMAVVDGVARIMTSTLETQQVYEDFALEMKKLVDFERATISVVDQDAGAFVVKYVFGQPYVPRPIGTTLPLEGSQTKQVIDTGQTIIRQDLRESPIFADDQENIELGLLSSIAVPMISSGKVFGTLLLRCSRANAYQQREQAILERLASQIAPAVENAQLYQDLQTSFEEMEVADQVAAIITSTLDIDQVYEKFAQEVKKLADFDRIVISVADLDAGTYILAYQYGLPMGSQGVGATFELSGTDVEKAVLSRQTTFRLYTKDSKDKRDQIRISVGLRSGITVPLIVGGKVIGTMNLHSRNKGAYGERERIALERLANQIAPAIENARLFQATLKAQDALRDSESRFRQLYDEAPVGYHEMDAAGRITRVNRTELEMLGYNAVEMLGQPAHRFIVEESLPEMAQTDNLMSFWYPRQNYELNFRRKDGSTLPTLVESRALRDEEGNLVGLRCTIQDITERKHTEERLQETSRLASIGELAAGVAHEINNPLTSILGFSQILLGESLPPSVNEDLQKIYFGAQRASKIVQNLLSFARKRDPERRLIDITPVLERALDLKSFDFKTGNIKVVCQLDEDLPHTMADEYQLIQVIMNILNNAQQAMNEFRGAGQLMIQTSQIRDCIRISISDDGPGIPHEHINKIFEPFFTTKSVGTGTGLGLSICYGIIQQHDGELWVDSPPGGGTTFHIELPAAGTIVESEETEDQPRPTVSDIKHLLVVDDEPHIRDLLARSLGQERYTVDLAEDGQEAWRKVRSRSYDCIIMDLKMPKMSGQELFGLITEFKPNLAQKSIFMTGDMVTPETQAFVSSVNSPTLSKPFELEELRSHIQALLEP